MATKPKTSAKNPTATAPAPSPAPAPAPATLNPQEISEAITRLLPGAPSIYADSLFQIGISPFVSKAIVGTYNPADAKANVGTITVINMPTRALLDLATNILRAFAAQGLLERIEEGQKSLVDLIGKVRIANQGSQVH